jgi:hypothetical protein
VVQEEAVRRVDQAAVLTAQERRGGRIQESVLTAPMVVTRIIQYVAKPGKDAALVLTLRQALVGRYEFDWGTITGTIVDTVHPRQEDLLGMANRQPGVWMGGPRDVGRSSYQETTMAEPPKTAPPTPPLEVPPPAPGMTVPDQGPAFDDTDAALATGLITMGGYEFAYTIAMSLQSFVSAIEAETMERPRYLTPDRCLRIASAILHYIPDDWNPAPEIL